MGMNPRISNITEVLGRVIPLPESVCCPTCKIGEIEGSDSLPDGDVYMYALFRAGIEGTNTFLDNLNIGPSTQIDPTFGGFLSLYQDYVPSPDGLIEIGSLGSDSSLDVFLKMVEKLFYSNSDRISFINNVLNQGIVFLCVNGQGIVTNLNRTLTLLTTKDMTYNSEPFSCNVSLYS